MFECVSLALADAKCEEAAENDDFDAAEELNQKIEELNAEIQELEAKLKEHPDTTADSSLPDQAPTSPSAEEPAQQQQSNEAATENLFADMSLAASEDINAPEGTGPEAAPTSDDDEEANDDPMEADKIDVGAKQEEELEEENAEKPSPEMATEEKHSDDEKDEEGEEGAQPSNVSTHSAEGEKEEEEIPPTEENLEEKEKADEEKEVAEDNGGSAEKDNSDAEE